MNRRRQTPNMACPKCGGNTEVKDSRPSAHNRVHRRRHCQQCPHRFYTYEILIGDTKKPYVQGLNKVREAAAHLVTQLDDLVLHYPNEEAPVE